VREAPRSGLVTAGVLLTAIPWGISALTALSFNFKNESGYLLIPFAGPWMTLGRRNYGNCDSESSSTETWACVANPFVVMGLIVDGVLQVAGGSLLLTGYVATTKRLVRGNATLSLTPLKFGTGYGIGAIGTF
jgi:hypothetical protein